MKKGEIRQLGTAPSIFWKYDEVRAAKERGLLYQGNSSPSLMLSQLVSV